VWLLVLALQLADDVSAAVSASACVWDRLWGLATEAQSLLPWR
jgi:hypothetical protein